MNIAVVAAVIGGVEYHRLLVPYRVLARRGHEVAFVDRIITAENAPTWREKFGLDVEVGTLIGPAGNGNIRILRKPDVVVMARHRSNEWRMTLPALRAAGVSMIVDMDDDHIHPMDDNPYAGEVTRALPYTMELIRRADVLTVATGTLWELYAGDRQQKPTVLAKNRIADEVLAEFARSMYSGAPKREGQIRIGWAGSGTHVHDLQSVAKALNDVLADNEEVRLVFIGADHRGIVAPAFSDRAEYIGGCWADASRGLRVEDFDDPLPVKALRLVDEAALDIAIAPLLPTAFNRARSDIKLLEYGALGIPTVASNFGPYAAYAKSVPYEAVTLAHERRDWRSKLGRLVGSALERARLGGSMHIAAVAARASVAEDWERALQMLPNYTKPFAPLEA